MPQHDLTLRPTVLTGERLKDDYCVWREGRCVGRIRFAREFNGTNWAWFINPPLPIPAWATGAANSLEDAKAAFRTAWERFYDTLTPRMIAHWHQTDDATKARGYNQPESKRK